MRICPCRKSPSSLASRARACGTISAKTGLIRRFEGTRRILEAIYRQAKEIGELTEGKPQRTAWQIMREIDSLED